MMYVPVPYFWLFSCMKSQSEYCTLYVAHIHRLIGSWHAVLSSSIGFLSISFDSASSNVHCKCSFINHDMNTGFYAPQQKYVQ